MDLFESSSSDSESVVEVTSSPEKFKSHPRTKGFKKKGLRNKRLFRISSDSDCSISSIKSGEKDIEFQRKSPDSAYSSTMETSPHGYEKHPLELKIENLAVSIREKKSLLRSRIGVKPKKQASLIFEVEMLEAEMKDLKLKYEATLNGEVLNEDGPSLHLDNENSPTQDGKKENNEGPRLRIMNGMDSDTIDALKNLHDSLKSCPAENVMAEQPKGLSIPLMPHQRHGLAWMLWREQQTPSGGILADDMGLGKTLSMISLIVKHKEDAGKKKITGCLPKGGTLVVCPTTVLGQWEAEIRRSCKNFSLSFMVYHGSQRPTKHSGLLQYDVVLTTYGIIQSECKSIPRKGQLTGKDGPVHSVDWTRIILDEAHMVRNYKSKTSQAICLLRGQYKWALTGTPIHNKELDIFALLVFLRCSPFDKYSVWCRWIDNKTMAGTQRMSMLIISLMLRRTKDQLMSKDSLLCLPTRKEHCEVLNLDELEQSVYDQILITSKNLFAKFLDQHTKRNAERLGMKESSSQSSNLIPVSGIWSKDLKSGKASSAWKRLQENSNVKSHHIFTLLLRLHQVCSHPALIQSMLEVEDYRDGGIIDEGRSDIDLVSQLNEIKLVDQKYIEDEISGIDEFIRKPLTLNNPIFKRERPSTKLIALMQCLEEKILTGKDKAVVVSQWTSMLNIIGFHLKKKNIKYYLLSGSVPLKERMEIIDSINNNTRGPKVLLLSLRTGGVGLNLVGANHLLVVDLHWNPQLEAQACDRIYRVGQEKGVHIYRFVCKHTVEQKIQELQEKKLSLADSILTGAKNPHGNTVTIEDLKTLFGLKF